MKIHTTQNLNSLVQRNQQSTDNVSKDFRLKNYSEQMLMPKMSAEKADFYSSSISFGAKLPKNLKDGKKIIKSVNKKVGDIKKEGVPEVKRGDSFRTSSFFNGALNVTDYETLATALVAAVACGFRASTIMALPTKKNKEDNRYAASHAAASGIVGFMTAFALTAPFKAGSNYVMQNMKKELSEKTLKKLYPHIDLKSIVKADGKRKDIKEWKDIYGNRFVDAMKKSEQLPLIRNLADVSEQTFNKVLLKGKEVDWAAQKGKSFNDVVLKDGSKLYDTIDMSNLGIFIKEDGMNEAQIMLKDFNKDFMQNLIKDAKESKSKWGDIDINSMYDKNDKVIDFRHWKDVNGKQWKLDLDEIGVSSPYETCDYKPRISGKKRLDSKENIYKYCSYQENGVNGRLGTEITNEMAEADAANDGLFKTLTWAPDLLFRVPVAALTVALIPWSLKNLFNIQKSSAKKKAEIVKTPDKAQEDNNKKSVSFKGKEQSTNFVKKYWGKLMDAVGEFLGKLYGKPLIESPTLQKLSEKLSKLPGNLTQHMTAFGSLITSSVYMQQTLTNKELDPDRRRTLAINQGLCFIVPTAAAYTVDKAINNWVKKNEYRYSGQYQHVIDIAKDEGKDTKEIAEKAATLSKKLKGFRTLASITVFALIYRYFTPVIMTPVANWFGDKLNAKKAEQKAHEVALNQEDSNTAKEISLNPEKEDIKKSA